LRAVSEPPHDVLAAEEFVVPAPDPDLRRPIRLPDDPTGSAEPHDVLAAEEFPLPAVQPRSAERMSAPRRRGLASAAGALVLFVLGRRWRR
jgi:hypothetical protein